MELTELYPNDPCKAMLDKYFVYKHLSPELQEVSEPICQLARDMYMLLPPGPEKTSGMRKLLEAKDCFVRAALDKKHGLSERFGYNGSGLKEEG